MNKKLKAGLCLLLTLCITISLALGVSASEEDPETSGTTSMNLDIESYKVSSIRAGKTATLRITVKNNSGECYKNVVLTLSGFSETGLALNGESNRKNVGSIEAGETYEAEFKLLCSSMATTGNYPLELTATAKDHDTPYSMGSIFVSVIGSSSSSDSGDDDDTVRDEPLGTVFVVPQNSSLPALQAGTTAKVQIPLRCTSLSSVGRTQISVGPLPDHISFATAGSVYDLSFGGGDTKNLELSLTADKELAAGTYGIPLKVGYKYYDGVETKTRTDEITAYIRVLEADGSAAGGGKLIISGYKLSRSKVSEGQSFQMTVSLQNNGDSNYNNVQVDLSNLSSEAIAMNGELNTKTIPTIKKGETQNVVFSLLCNSKMATGNYQLTINVSADELSSESGGGVSGNQSMTASVFIPITGTAAKEDAGENNASKPQIIVDNYDYGGMSVTGGQDFLLQMNFRNTSPNYSIENLKMVIDSVPDGDNSVRAFTPSKSSNTLFVSSVNPGQPFSWDIDLYPKADAEPKSYGVEISYTYEAVIDGVRHTDLSGKETITIPLTQPDRFEVTDPELYGPIYLGDQANLMINYVNKGKSKIFNLSVSLAGNFTSGDMNSYVGNVESGTGDYFDTMLTPQEVGTLSGTATFTYEDANGDTKEVVKEFSCDVMEMPTYEPDPMDPGITDPGLMEPQGLPGWANWVIIGFGVVSGIAALVVIGKLVQKKKQRLLDEMDDFDDEE